MVLWVDWAQLAGSCLGMLMPVQLDISWVFSHLKELLAGCQESLVPWRAVDAGQGPGLWTGVPITCPLWVAGASHSILAVGASKSELSKTLLRSCKAAYDLAVDIPECHFLCILLVK